jgi:Ca2+-transporting ATPase
MPARTPYVVSESPTEREPSGSLAAEEVLCQLGTSRRGLPSAAVAERLARYGPNVLIEARAIPLWQKFAANLTNFFALLL